MNNKNFLVLGFLGLVFFAIACGSKTNAAGSAAAISYHDSREADELSATKDYGPLIVRPGQTQAEWTKKPWSSWWYPLNETTLFDTAGNGPSTLEKYDTYNQKAHRNNSTAVDYERKNIYDPQASGWEGLCNAWATASILESEPSHPITVQGITFSVADQKALLLKSYEQVPGLKVYGQRYDGNPGDDYADIYPDQFHRVMVGELFEKGRPFIIDKEAGAPVWNEPVYGVLTTIAVDSHDGGLLHVDTWLSWADSGDVDPNYVGTRKVNHEYTYDLQANVQADGSYKVYNGTWTGDSVHEHPDFVTIVPDHAVAHSSLNTQIDSAVVDEILSRH